MIPVELHYGASTDVGLLREVNEDSHLVAPPVFVVADGMGGHDHGDVASRLVVEEFRELAVQGYDAARGAEAVARTLAAAQARIAEFDATNARSGGPTASSGTTVVVALLVEQDDGPRWLLANVGDSRIYRFSPAGLDQVSVDHSVVQELIDAGHLSAAAAAEHPERHVITRALGGTVSGEADYFLLPLGSAERLLLCSDGVSGMIDDVEIAGILGRYDDPRDAADRLVAAAVAAGGRDNATAVVVDVVGLGDDTPYDSHAQRASLEQKLGALP
ncbi:MAG TPA: protein phosphatase 2C domain-containing protein [Nocardioides sp.]|nr:protein phosphatase 2C domain-containing protein [Nocardioides sp.]